MAAALWGTKSIYRPMPRSSKVLKSDDWPTVKASERTEIHAIVGTQLGAGKTYGQDSCHFVRNLKLAPFINRLVTFDPCLCKLCLETIRGIA
jgi:hypothetical protein